MAEPAISRRVVTLVLESDLPAPNVQPGLGPEPSPLIIGPDISPLTVGLGSEPFPLALHPYIQGSKGDPGNNEIGGYGFSILDLESGHHLEFSGSAWINVPKQTLSDGGNF